jgi:hypothetical protein
MDGARIYWGSQLYIHSLVEVPHSCHMCYMPHPANLLDLINIIFYERCPGLRPGQWEFESRQGLGICLFTTTSKPALGPAQSLMQWDSFPGSKAAGAWMWPLNSIQYRERVDLHIHSQYAFMAWCSIKAQGQLYLLPLQIMKLLIMNFFPASCYFFTHRSKFS